MHLKDLYQPALKPPGTMPRYKARAAEAATATHRERIRKKKLSKAMDKAELTATFQAASSDNDFDRAGYCRYMRDWAEELENFDSLEQERITSLIADYFYGRLTPTAWREIRNALVEQRRANMQRHPAPVISPWSYGANPSDGW